MKIEDYFLSGVFSYGYWIYGYCDLLNKLFYFLLEPFFPIMSPDLSIFFKVIIRNSRYPSIPEAWARSLLQILKFQTLIGQIEKLFSRWPSNFLYYRGQRKTYHIIIRISISFGIFCKQNLTIISRKKQNTFIR